MDSIEFGKICRPLNILYIEVFDEVPCSGDYLCNQEEYLSALFFAKKIVRKFLPFMVAVGPLLKIKSLYQKS